MSAVHEWKLAEQSLVCYLEAGCAPLDAVNGFKKLMDTIEIANRADHTQESINNVCAAGLLPPNYMAPKPGEKPLAT